MFNSTTRAVVCALFLAVTPVIRATDLTNSITGRVSDGSRSLPYRVFQPTGADSTEKMPLIVFLHGIGDRGTDNVAQTSRLTPILNNTRSGRFASYVMAPQIGTDQWFQSFSNKPTEAMSLTIKAVKEVIATENIDPSRVYVTGLSMGGMGTWDIIRREPNLFAAAVPMSGGGDVKTASIVKDIPIWAFHGGADSVVPVDQTRAMINAVIAAGGSPRYTEIPGADHDIWGPIYADKDHELYPWLFAQHLDTTPLASDATLSMSYQPAIQSPVMSPVPEPGTLSLVALAGAGLFLGRRRR